MKRILAAAATVFFIGVAATLVSPALLPPTVHQLAPAPVLRLTAVCHTADGHTGDLAVDATGEFCWITK